MASRKGLIILRKQFKPLTCVEICAGGGGQSLGLSMAGFTHVALVELVPDYVKNMKKNRPEWPVIQSDVHDFNGKPYKNVDLFAGGVPCPPFSVAGKQLGKNDARDLFPEALRLIKEIKPKTIMLENVRGFLDPVFDSYRKQLFDQIRELGYSNVKIKLLNASDYGVPQLRPRVVILASRDDLGIKIDYPKPHPEDTPSVGETLFSLMKARGWKKAKAWAKNASGIAPTLVGGSEKHGGPDLGPTRSKKAWADQFNVNGISIANEAPSPAFDGMPRLTVRMLARIQSFPDQWTFGPYKTKACRMIGNAFPPLVAEAVGKEIARGLRNAK